MKITFIRPCMTGRQSSDALKPLAFAILLGLTPKDFDTAFYDEHVELLPEHIDGDALVFSVETLAAKRSYVLAKQYAERNPRLQIIMGGFHPTACPDEALQFAHCVVLGDAEPVWPQLIADLRNHALQPRYTSPNNHMLPVARMDTSIFEGKKYAKCGVVQWKRGCVYHCNFCSIRGFYQSRILERDISDVIQEIAALKEKLFFLADDNLLHNREKVKQFLTRLAPLKKKWGCQVGIQVAKDAEILALMQKSGCLMAVVGFESLCEDTLSHIGKQQRAAEYDEAIRAFHAHGIMLYATFIFGYPDDKADSFDRVYSFVMKHKPAIVNFNPLLVMPGTELYTQLNQQGKLTDSQWWLSEGYRYGDATHIPEQMSPEQLTEGCRKLRYRFYSLSGILRRTFSRVNFRHFGVYFLINIISYVEIRRKQRLRHGGDRPL